MEQRKQAIFTGSIADGFSIERIVDDAETAQNFVIAHLANGKLAEAIEIQPPSTKSKREKDYDNGIDFVVFGSGISNGFTMFGPFPDWETANEFGEAHRGEDEEWEHFQTTDPVTKFECDLLARLKQDCEYYLGAGGRHKKHLWAADESLQIQKMKEIYAGLSDKPDWITLEMIHGYEEKMVQGAAQLTMVRVKDEYEDGVCPDCGQEIPIDAKHGEAFASDACSQR